MFQRFPADNIAEQVHSPSLDALQVDIGIFEGERLARECHLPGLAALPEALQSMRVMTDRILQQYV